MSYSKTALVTHHRESAAENMLIVADTLLTMAGRSWTALYRYRYY